jgi:hypothetical protein
MVVCEWPAVVVAVAAAGASSPPLEVHPTATASTTMTRAVRPARIRTMPLLKKAPWFQATGQYGKLGEFSHRLF